MGCCSIQSEQRFVWRELGECFFSLLRCDLSCVQTHRSLVLQPKWFVCDRTGSIDMIQC